MTNSDYIGLVGVAAIILGGIFMFYRSKSLSSIETHKKSVQQQVSYPLRLQAYERMILFLERIKPQNLLTRIDISGINTMELQSTILREIRGEFDHNAAQQLYLSKNTWGKISAAATTLSGSLVHSISQCPEGFTTKEAVIYLLQNEDESASNLIREAINAIKDEAQQNF